MPIGRSEVRNSLASFRNALFRFRCLQLSASRFNGFYAPSLGILHAITAAGVVFCVYGAARAEAAFALFFGYMAVLWICAYLMVLNMFAELNAASKNLLTLSGAALSSICCWADIQ